MVRSDNKIDLTIGDRARNRVGEIAREIMRRLTEGNGSLAISDSSSPEQIKAEFKCSKKDFKKAIGKLYKERKIVLDGAGISLADQT